MDGVGRGTGRDFGDEGAALDARAGWKSEIVSHKGHRVHKVFVLFVFFVAQILSGGRNGCQGEGCDRGCAAHGYFRIHIVPAPGKADVAPPAVRR